MVPPGQIISAALNGKRDTIPLELVHKHNGTRNSSLASKTYPRGDLEGDPRWRSAGNNQTIDSNLNLRVLHAQPPFLKKVSPPSLQYNGFLTYFGTLPFDSRFDSGESSTCTRGSTIGAVAEADALAGWLVLHAHASPAYATAILDACMSVQMGLLLVFPIVLMLALLLAVCQCACTVFLDAALAVAGLALNVASAPPMVHVYAISCVMKTCMHMIFSRLMIKSAMLIFIISNVPISLAAGRSDPAISTDEYLLPGVTRWDGIPYNEFRLVWWIALCAALGNIAQDGWTLLQTARDQDVGGPTVGGTPVQRQQSQNRNQRLFGAMLKYIDNNSWVYRYAHRTFANNGRGLFNYIYVHGHLPYTSEQRTEMEHEWTNATMNSVGIRYTADAVFKWAEYVEKLAEKLNKSERDKRVKYLAGFPSSFDVMIVPERAQGAVGSYTHPANHPAHHPAAGTPHPLAGQPDIHATALAFYSEWERMIRHGQIRNVPRGMANRMDEDHDEDDDSPDEHARMARDRISKNTICLICGGAGHAGYVEGLGQCLSARLNHRIPGTDLARFQYPPGYGPAPRFRLRDDSNPAPRPRRDARNESNPHQTRSRARVIEPPPSDESPEEDVRYTNRPNTRTNPKPSPRPKPRPSPRDSRKSRQVEEEDKNKNKSDDQPNVTPHDANSSDSDEHAKLAVAFDAVVF